MASRYDPDMSQPVQDANASVVDRGSPDFHDTPPMRYQTPYVWMIFFSSMDIMLTWAILRRGGEEVNPVAELVIRSWGINGASAFKFALILFVIVSCEIVGRRTDRTGRRLAWFGVFVAASPVAWSLALLTDHILLRPLP